MEIKTNEMEKELKDKQMRFDQKIKEAEETNAKLKIVSDDINNKKWKFDPQKNHPWWTSVGKR